MLASDGIGLLRGLLGLARLLSLVLLLILRLFPLLVRLLIRILIVGVVHAEYPEVDARQEWLALINKRRGQGVASVRKFLSAAGRMKCSSGR